MRSPKAFTLIEVLAALALLSGSVVLLLTAQQRHLAALQSLTQKEKAVYLAHELITEWRLKSGDARPETRGEFPEAKGWHWSRTEEPVEDPESRLRRVTLHIFFSPDRLQDQLMEAYVWLEAARAK